MGLQRGISRRTAMGRLATLGGAFLTCNLASDLFAQANAPDNAIAQMRKTLSAIPPVKTRLSEQIDLISGPGGNIGVFTWSEGKLAVDSGVAGASEAILAQIDAIGPQPLRILVNTHWHFDHTDGNEAFHKKGALIVAHENVRKRMSTDQDIEFFHLRVPASPPAALPDNSFSTDTTLNLGPEEIRIVHVDPAHTDGDSFLQCVNANIIHAGDLLFTGRYPFIDKATGGSIGGMITAADRMLKSADASTKVIPGHGTVTNKDGLQRYRDMLADIRDRVQALKNQGKDMAGVIAAKPTQNYDAELGQGTFKPDQFVSIVFSTL